MKIVVTGASGNVGSGLLRALARTESVYDVIGVCRRPPSARPPFDAVRWHTLDLGTADAAARLTDTCEGADAIVHLAWAIQPVRDRCALRRVNVDGTAAVLRAAEQAGVGQIVHASSIAAYGPRDEAGPPVTENADTPGVPGSVYGQDKSEVEALVRAFADAHPETTVSVIRPTLVAQRGASASFRALFFDPIVPTLALRLAAHRRIPLLPLPRGLAVQLVHADDVGAAIVRILETRASGVFNLAADVLDTRALASLVGARPLQLPTALFRAAVSALWRLRLLRLSPGWFDVGTRVPLIDTTRATRELGWSPASSSREAADEQLRGLAANADGGSPALARDRLRTKTHLS